MKRLFMWKDFLLLPAVVMATSVSAQDYRAIVKGIVTDETGEIGRAHV